MIKLTQWFSSKLLPVRKGWYEVGHDAKFYPYPRKHKLTGNRRYFDGKNWRAGWSNELISIFGSHESHIWRGLAEPPRKGRS